MWVACIPLISSTNHERRQPEAEQLMLSARKLCMSAYSKHGSIDDAETALLKAVESKMYTGRYYSVEAHLVRVDQNRARIYCYPITPGDGFTFMEFEWDSNESRIQWNPRRRR